MKLLLLGGGGGGVNVGTEGQSVAECPTADVDHQRSSRVGAGMSRFVWVLLSK